jgi:Ni,Fe-hydrogenase III small subunit
MFKILKERVIKGIVTRYIKPDAGAQITVTGKELKALIREKFGRSLQIREVDTASCGGCESEIISANNPIYDLQRFGISFVASPRHADALMVTGALSKNMLSALLKTYNAMPESKFVITFGDCALDGGVFKDSYYTAGAVKDHLPVVLHIPGCPPSPRKLVQALTAFLQQQ